VERGSASECGYDELDYENRIRRNHRQGLRMSVLVSDRRESKFEAITYSIELHAMLTELMQRSFGVRDLDNLVRIRYAYGKDDKEDFAKYRYLMQNSKNRIDQIASLLTSNVRAANTLYPTSLHEYERRRDYQNIAIANCEQLIKELQRVVEIFEVDINIYGKYIKAINREIGLIKKWRQRDNKIKSYLQGSI
jgi:hypothetical protein